MWLVKAGGARNIALWWGFEKGREEEAVCRVGGALPGAAGLVAVESRPAVCAGLPIRRSGLVGEEKSDNSNGAVSALVQGYLKNSVT